MQRLEKNINLIDWKKLLLDYYKTLYLNEEDVMVIFMIDLCIEQGTTFVTPDILALKMNYSMEVVDKTFVNLMSRGYVSNVQDANKKFATSLNGIKEVLISQFFVDNQKEKSKVNSEEQESVYSLFENEFARPLNAFEIDIIRDWSEQGYTLDKIKYALAEAVRSKVKSIRYVDKILLNMKQQEERVKEGNTTLSSKWRKDIDETMELAKATWVSKNEY